MEKQICECGKVIEGYFKTHVDYLMTQHKLSKEHIKFTKSEDNEIKKDKKDKKK